MKHPQGMQPVTAMQRLDDVPHGDFVTIEQAARLLGVSATTVWRLIRDGSLPATRIGRKLLRVRQRDLASVVTRVGVEPEQSSFARNEPLKSTTIPMPEELQRRRELVERMRKDVDKAVRSGRISAKEARQFLRFYEDGKYTFELTVTQNGRTSAPAEVTVLVEKVELEFRTYPQLGEGEEEAFNAALQAKVDGIIIFSSRPEDRLDCRARRNFSAQAAICRRCLPGSPPARNRQATPRPSSAGCP